jgi:hypothetical protein
LMPFRQLLEDALQHDGRGSAFCHFATRYDVEWGTESRLGTESKDFLRLTCGCQ